MVPTVTSQSLHYLSAPSSPKRFGYPSTPSSDFYYYTSAPASPSRTEFSFDQAFGFSGQLRNDESESAFAAADDLFEGGMIRPMIPNSSQFQPSLSSPLLNLGKERSTEERGRSSSSPSANQRTGARSLSPGRGNTEFHQSQAPSSQTGSLARGGGGSKKWRLKDLFLFRSASEGRATGGGSKDPLRKYTLLSATSSSDIKYNDPNNGSMRKPRGAHERHYMMNRAATEENKKKTPLPFHRNTLFGYLRSNPAIHSISRRWNGCYSNQSRS